MNKMIFILATALALAGCGQQGAEEESPASGFETIPVSKQDITLEQSYPAQVEGRQFIKIIPRVEGYLRQICVKEGQRVKKGQVLFVIDQASYQAEVKAAEANVAVAKAQSQQAQALLQSARTNLSYTVLRSPSDGVVGSLPFRVGDFVGPSPQSGLTTVADAHEMYVYFSLTERDAMSRIARYGSLDKAVAAFPPVILLTANDDT